MSSASKTASESTEIVDEKNDQLITEFFEENNEFYQYEKITGIPGKTEIYDNENLDMNTIELEFGFFSKTTTVSLMKSAPYYANKATRGVYTLDSLDKKLPEKEVRNYQVYKNNISVIKGEGTKLAEIEDGENLKKVLVTDSFVSTTKLVDGTFIQKTVTKSKEDKIYVNHLSEFRFSVTPNFLPNTLKTYLGSYIKGSEAIYFYENKFANLKEEQIISNKYDEAQKTFTLEATTDNETHKAVCKEELTDYIEQE